MSRGIAETDAASVLQEFRILVRARPDVGERLRTAFDSITSETRRLIDNARTAPRAAGDHVGRRSVLPDLTGLDGSLALLSVLADAEERHGTAPLLEIPEHRVGIARGLAVHAWAEGPRVLRARLEHVMRELGDDAP